LNRSDVILRKNKENIFEHSVSSFDSARDENNIVTLIKVKVAKDISKKRIVIKRS
jgi:hypothetical protein